LLPENADGDREYHERYGLLAGYGLNARGTRGDLSSAPLRAEHPILETGRAREVCRARCHLAGLRGGRSGEQNEGGAERAEAAGQDSFFKGSRATMYAAPFGFTSERIRTFGSARETDLMVAVDSEREPAARPVRSQEFHGWSSGGNGPWFLCEADSPGGGIGGCGRRSERSTSGAAASRRCPIVGSSPGGGGDASEHRPFYEG